MTEYPDDLEVVPRRLQPGQRAEVWTAESSSGSAELVYATDSLLLEAPNWAPDGRGLLLNGDGLLWRLELEPAVELTQVRIENLPPINNDHVLDAKRGLIYLSANDGHIYVAPIAGGAAKRVTRDSSRYHFLHGVSPDGETLAFVELSRADSSVPGRLALISSAGGETRYPEAGSSHLDGPEYSPDGAWLYFNTEEFATRPGHAQNWLACPSRAVAWSGWWNQSPSTGFRICRRTANLPATSAFRRARLGTRPTWMSRCDWCVPRIGATSCGPSRSSAGREPSTSTAGRRTVGGSPTLPIRSSRHKDVTCRPYPRT
jgi:hypothetical protein